ncbi:MAG TPA: MOSC domain-containing protein [Candidatus Rubrimentiphilum sp.]|nr:MOSC domain-containing protein [Candidatus Rubrimentiphilum sp.]
MDLGTLAAICRYPVKSLAAETLTRTHIETAGIPGDRVSALFAGEGHARAGKTYEGIHDDRLHLWKRAEDAVADAERRGVPLSVRSENGPYHFSLPISLIFDRWIAEVEANTGETLDPRRWRPNLVARAAPTFDLNEEDLIGKEIAVGTVVLRVVKPIKRCVVPSYDLNGGPPTPEVQNYIVRERKNVMGVYCEVESAGEVRTGDPISNST